MEKTITLKYRVLIFTMFFLLSSIIFPLFFPKSINASLPKTGLIASGIWSGGKNTNIVDADVLDNGNAILVGGKFWEIITPTGETVANGTLPLDESIDNLKIVKAMRNGNIFISGRYNWFVMTPEGNVITKGDVASSYNYILEVTELSNGDILIVETGRKYILTLDGNIINTNNWKINNNYFGISTSFSNGSTFFANSNNGSWVIVSPDGSETVIEGTWFNEPPQSLLSPIGASVAESLRSNGNVIVGGNFGIWQIVTPTGGIHAYGTWPAGLLYISAIEELSNGNIVLAGQCGHWVIIDPNGHNLARGLWELNINIFDVKELDNGNLLMVGTKGNWGIFTPPIIKSYTVNAKPDNPSYGSVLGSGLYNPGEPVTLTAIPNEGYKFAYWSIGETVISTSNPYRFIPDKDVTITANFKNEGDPSNGTIEFSGGTGTEEDPYIITTLEQLNEVRYNLTAHYKLGADIDAYETRFWNYGEGFEPIGRNDHQSNRFQGHFDGNGYKIKNLYIKRPKANYQGLFGATDNSAVVENVYLENVEIVGKSVTAGLIGTNIGGTVRNCHVTGIIIGDAASSAIGGLVGDNSGGTILNCHSSVFVFGNTNYIGGLVGYNLDGVIENSYSTGDVSTLNGENIGGLVGYNNGNSIIRNTYFIGNVFSNKKYVGGLVGQNIYNANQKYESKIENSYVVADIHSGSDSYTYIGAFVGHSLKGTQLVRNCYFNYDFEKNATASPAIPKVTSEMKRQITYQNWDFINIWAIDPNINEGYPYLISNPPAPESPTQQEPSQEITITVLAGVGGTAAGGGKYPYNSQVLVTANPLPGYKFSYWTVNDTIVSTENPYIFTATEDLTLTANFSPVTYMVMVETVGNGTVTGAGSYTYNATATLTATPASGYRFVNWTDENGNVVSTNPTYTFTVTGDRKLTANFAQISSYTITVNTVGDGTVTGAGTYEAGQIVTLKAIPAENARFVSWTDQNGNVLSTALTYIFTASADIVITANFEPLTYQISVISTNGTVTGAGTYNYGDIVVLTATPDEGYHFVKWIENGKTLSTDTTLTFTATSDRQIIAQFAPNTFTVTVEASEGGKATGGGTYSYNATVTVKATPNSGYVFESWTESGTVLSTSPSYTFTVTRNMYLKANFKPSDSMNVSWEKTVYKTYMVTWQGGVPNATVELRQNGNIVYSAKGYMNNAVFPATVVPGDYQIFIAGIDTGVILTATSDSSSTPSQPEPEPEPITDVTFEKTKYGTYQVTWQGPKSATAELKQNGNALYSAKGIFNSAVFPSTVEPGIYDLYIDGTFIRSVSIGQDKPDTTPTTPATPEAPTNVTFEKTKYGTYQVKWTGEKSATVELKQNGTTLYKANGLFNSAVFPSTVAAGTYELYIGGTFIQNVTIESAAPATPTTPTQPDPITDITFEKTKYGTYQVKWTGPKSAVVELKQNDEVIYKANGLFNSAVFPANTAPGTYELFIDGQHVQTIVIEGTVQPNTPTKSEEPTDVTFEKTKYGTYQVKWIGVKTATVELRQDDKTIYTAKGTFNSAVFPSTVAAGRYELFIDGHHVQSIVIE